CRPISKFCKLIGIKSCPYFDIKRASRNDIISHFEKHSVEYKIAKMFEIYHDNFTTLRDHKRPFKWTPFIFSIGTTDTSPLFLFTGNMHIPMDHVSFACVQLWAAEQTKREDVMELNFWSKLTSLHIGWNIHAYSVQEAPFMLKDIPIKIPLQCVDNLFSGVQDEFGITAAIRSSGASSTRTRMRTVVRSPIVPMFVVGLPLPERKREVTSVDEQEGQGHMGTVLVILFVAFFIWLFQKR
ncbi:hypothetical protein Ocin01_19134, partial [Orchesella cincta]